MLSDIIQRHGLSLPGAAPAATSRDVSAPDEVHWHLWSCIGHLQLTAEVLRRFKRALRPVILDCRTDEDTAQTVVSAAGVHLEQLDELSDRPGRFFRWEAFSPVLEIKGRLRTFVQVLDAKPHDAPARWTAGLDDELKRVLATLLGEAERLYQEVSQRSERQINLSSQPDRPPTQPPPSELAL
jgi:hypothetical protein